MPTAPGFTRARIGRVLGLVGQVETRWARIHLSPAERKWLQKWSKDAHDTIERALLRLAGKADPDERSKFLPRDTLSWSNTVPDPAGFLCFPSLEYEGIKRYLEWLFSHSGPESRMFRRLSQLVSYVVLACLDSRQLSTVRSNPSSLFSLLLASRYSRAMRGRAVSRESASISRRFW